MSGESRNRWSIDFPSLTDFSRNHIWVPEGTVCTIMQRCSTDFEQVDDWLIERLGPRRERWDKAPTISMRLGGGSHVWQDYAVTDPDVAFEFKMVWG